MTKQIGTGKIVMDLSIVFGFYKYLISKSWTTTCEEGWRDLFGERENVRWSPWLVIGGREMIFSSCNVKVQSDLIIAFIEQPPFAHNMRKKWVALLASPYTKSAIIARYPSLKYVNPPHPSPTAADSTRFELNSSLSSTFLIVSWNRALCNF